MTFVCRFLVVCLSVVIVRQAWAEPMPDELRTVLKTFRAEGSKGWSFTQTTRGDGKSQTERFDPRAHEYKRWTLLEKDGHPPTPEEAKRYNELQTRRSTGESAPNVKDQLDESSGERLSDDGVRSLWRFKLRATEKDDTSAAHMYATFTLHRPSATIERVELASFEPFRPVLGISITEAKTVMDYSVPENGRPTLLKSVTMKVRGRAWWFRSMDQDLEITYSDYVSLRPSPAPTPVSANETSR